MMCIQAHKKDQKGTALVPGPPKLIKNKQDDPNFLRRSKSNSSIYLKVPDNVSGFYIGLVNFHRLGADGFVSQGLPKPLSTVRLGFGVHGAEFRDWACRFFEAVLGGLESTSSICIQARNVGT